MKKLLVDVFVFALTCTASLFITVIEGFLCAMMDKQLTKAAEFVFGFSWHSAEFYFILMVVSFVAKIAYIYPMWRKRYDA